MKKSSLFAMVFGSISFMLFALGMCMALIQEWNAMQSGIILGCIGLVLALITLFIWRKMEHKVPIQLSMKTVASILIIVMGSLILGVGMCYTIIWNEMIKGIVIGMIGIIILISSIPFSKGVKA